MSIYSSIPEMKPYMTCSIHCNCFLLQPSPCLRSQKMKVRLARDSCAQNTKKAPSAQEKSSTCVLKKTQGPTSRAMTLLLSQTGTRGLSSKAVIDCGLRCCHTPAIYSKGYQYMKKASKALIYTELCRYIPSTRWLSIVPKYLLLGTPIASSMPKNSLLSCETLLCSIFCRCFKLLISVALPYTKDP